MARRVKQKSRIVIGDGSDDPLFGSYAKGHPHEWSDIDVAVIVPMVDKDKWMDTAVSLNRATDAISCYIEPILLENGEDSPIYREVMRTSVAVS